jgi:putative hydrolase of the HAD superfamily
LIKKYEKCLWRDLIYIADDPAKDFINLNKKGCITIRIKKGRFAKRKVVKKFDAKYSIDHLTELFKLNLKYKFD